MSYPIIDLRSDTFTLPSDAMRQAMAYAPVGDDVFGEDLTVNELERYSAELFGTEAALYCVSGTQSNQIAINVHTQPGDEVICADLAHIYIYEGGGIALNSGCSVRLIAGNLGRFTASDVVNNINNKNDIHLPLTRLVCIEDTVNKGGGAIWDFEEIKRIKKVCHENNLALHCDGARLFNALIETGISPKEYAAQFDSISICLSKGLGAPVGSVLVGSKDFIAKAKRRRKSLGGGMRQAGIIAAGALFALQNNVERLKIDHHNAKRIAEVLMLHPEIVGVLPAETNIVIFETKKPEGADEMIQWLKSKNILCFPFGKNKVRMVFHLGIDERMIAELINVFQQSFLLE
jgi:threonine aldolase